MGVAPGAFAFLDHPNPIAYAHRGGSSEAPENSLAAFARATTLGFRYLETDARLTADGVLVCMHDPDIARVSDRVGAVAQLTYAELAAARLVGPAGVSDQRIPRLEDLFATWPAARLNIDAKEDRAVAPLAELVNRLGALDRVCMGAFSDARIAELRARLGEGLCTALGPRSVARLRARSIGVPLRAPDGVVAQVPVKMSYRVGPLPLPLPVVDRLFLRAATKVGVVVHVWTVDKAAEMQRLLDLGVGGLMTDEPSTLRSVLQARGQWS